MEDSTEIIAVVRGASNVEVQVIFRALADKWRPVPQLARAGLFFSGGIRSVSPNSPTAKICYCGCGTVCRAPPSSGAPVNFDVCLSAAQGKDAW